MSPPLQVAIYSSIIVLGALLGALVPFGARKPKQLSTLLAFAAGAMLGAAFFHMLPEAFHGGGYLAFSLVPVGFLFLFLLERYLLVHTCEEPPDCAEHGHGKALGMTAFLGLSAHTLFDGIALGSSVMEGVGLMAFVAIAAHKVPSSLSLAAILQAEGRSGRSVMGFAALYGMMVPFGVLLYFAFGVVLPLTALAPKALAFSAGTFLYIAVSDLLPHVNRHGKEGRLVNIASMAFGLLVMFGLTYVTEHSHG